MRVNHFESTLEGNLVNKIGLHKHTNQKTNHKSTGKTKNESLIDTTILPFSLSYDHRVINGVDAGNFMTFIKATIEKGL